MIRRFAGLAFGAEGKTFTITNTPPVVNVARRNPHRASRSNSVPIYRG